VILVPWLFNFLLQRKRELALTVAMLLAAFYLDRIPLAARVSPPLSQVERGRRVYISEGCINCHTQFVRPNSPDVLMWGRLSPFRSFDRSARFSLETGARVRTLRRSAADAHGLAQGSFLRSA